MGITIQYNSRHEKRYNTKAKEQSRKRHNKHKLLKSEYIVDKCCSHCGKDETCALDFQHMDETVKNFNISGGHQRSWNITLEEINKCITLYANCHIKYHHGSLSYLTFGE